MARRFSVVSFVLLSLNLIFLRHAWGALQIDDSDPSFQALVQKEIDLMKEGKRGLACQVLVDRLEKSSATTTIKPVTSDETTWHPNDRKGTRSHVVPLDTKLRGAARTSPTSSVLYLHPSRIDPRLSLFKLGTFPHELAISVDLNRGEYPGDYRLVEKRATFFKNGWRESLNLPLIQIADRVPTPEYQTAKREGLISEEDREFFPILDVQKVEPVKRTEEKSAVETP